MAVQGAQHTVESSGFIITLLYLTNQFWEPLIAPQIVQHFHLSYCGFLFLPRF